MSRGLAIIAVEMLIARSKWRVILSPDPNSASPSSGSEATADSKYGATSGSFPKSPTRPEPETTVVTRVEFSATAPLSRPVIVYSGSKGFSKAYVSLNAR